MQAALDHIMQAARFTSITIAHRLSTIRRADKIAVINSGRVVEEGTYNSLVEKGEGGVFFKLSKKQEANAKEDLEMIEEVQRKLSADALNVDSSGGLSVDAVTPRVTPQVSAGSNNNSLDQAERGAAGDEKGAKAKKAKNNFSDRVGKMYAPEDKKFLVLGTVCAITVGVAQGSLGAMITKSIFSLQDYRALPPLPSDHFYHSRATC